MTLWELNQKTITTIFDTGAGKIELLKGMNENSIVDKFIRRKGLGVHNIALRIKNLKVIIYYLRKNNK